MATKKAAANEKDLLDLRLITSSYNHRNPISDDFRKDGYGVFEGDVPVVMPGQDAKPPLWSLATSDDPVERATFVELMKKYENPEKVQDSIISLAHNILSVGLINAINVRDNGKRKDGSHTYQLVAGHRRSLAMLYLWCAGLTKSKAPRLRYELAHGNHQALQAQAMSENIHRKRLNLIEEAIAYKQALNSGETIDELAGREGKSVQTIQGRLSLLDLDLSTQAKIANGTIRYTKALEMAKNLKSGLGEVTDSGSTVDDEVREAASSRGTKRKMMSRKEVEEWYAETEDEVEKRVLARILQIGVENESEEDVIDDEEIESLAEELELGLDGTVGVAIAGTGTEKKGGKGKKKKKKKKALATA